MDFFAVRTSLPG